MDHADIANNDVAVAPRLHKTSRKNPRRKERERRVPKGRPSLLVVGLAVLAVLLAGGAGFLGWSVHNNSDATAQRAAILSSAQREAAALTTLSSQSGASDYDAVLAGSAGDLKEQLTAGRSQFLKTLGTAGVSSVGTVLDTGIVSVKNGTATVLIDVKATVKNKQTAKPEQRAYHWQATLVSSAGKWLVTSLEFV